MSDTKKNPALSSSSPTSSNPRPLGEVLASCIEEGSKAPTTREAARRAVACMLGRLSAALQDPDPAGPGTTGSDPETVVKETGDEVEALRKKVDP